MVLEDVDPVGTDGFAQGFKRFGHDLVIAFGAEQHARGPRQRAENSVARAAFVVAGIRLDIRGHRLVGPRPPPGAQTQDQQRAAERAQQERQSDQNEPLCRHSAPLGIQQARPAPTVQE